jgi:hypothetical protein
MGAITPALILSAVLVFAENQRKKEITLDGGKQAAFSVLKIDQKMGWYHTQN